jgi:DNA-binding winged helix-turn-helix (wHTH) protein/tetratricopeptide (TPR) repeat protein
MDRPLPEPADLQPVTYRFADLRLKSDGTLVRGETVLKLPALELALLRALLVRQGKPAGPSELNRALWGAPNPSGQSHTECLESLKELLSPTDCIESVYRRGYRIVAIAEPEQPPPAQSLPLLAILPFSAGYDVPEYIALALTEQTTEQLRGGQPAIASIAPRDSVRVLARRGLPRQEIGRMLGAEFLLSGELTATPASHRLRAEMIRVEDDAPLWMEDLIARRGAIGELAAELANRVSRRLHGAETSIHAAAASVAESEKSEGQREARDLYLRAHHEWQSMERHHMQNAMGRLLRAVELDDILMAARIDLAQLAILECIYGYLPPRIAAATVRRAAAGIPELNEQAVALLPALAWVEFHFERDARSALRMMKRSESLPYDPTNTRAHSWILHSRQRSGEAVELLHAAINTDRWSPWLQAALAWSLHLAGERDASVAQINKVLELFADYDNALFFAAMILAYNGESARSVEAAKTLTMRAPHYDLATSAHAYALACAGRRDEARELLDRLHWLSRERYVLNTLDAATHLVLGETNAALAELRAANESRCPWFFQILGDPRLKPLHEHPEFAELKAVHTAMEIDAGNPTP